MKIPVGLWSAGISLVGNVMLIVLDCHGLAHRVKHTNRNNLSFRGKPTGIIYGFLRYVLKYAMKFNTRHFVFAWDSKKSYRAEIYPEYKANRNNKEFTPEEQRAYKEAISQFHELRKEVLPRLGFRNNFIQTGVEADDIIARAVKDVKRHQALTDIVVVSRDNDLWQLLEWCDILDPEGDKLLTKEWLKNEYGIKPKQWAEAKCIMGCSTDNVSGIFNVGKDRVLKYVTGNLVKGKIFDRIISEEGQDIVSRNKPLIVLPFQGTKRRIIHFDEYFILSEFERVCEDYGFNSFLDMPAYNNWRKCFQMQ
jgi:5'-3' exonuclease